MSVFFLAEVLDVGRFWLAYDPFFAKNLNMNNANRRRVENTLSVHFVLSSITKANSKPYSSSYELKSRRYFAVWHTSISCTEIKPDILSLELQRKCFRALDLHHRKGSTEKASFLNLLPSIINQWVDLYPILMNLILSVLYWIFFWNIVREL